MARKQEIVFDERGWTAFKPVLVALALAWKNQRRYLEKDSDCPQSLWTLGRRQPKEGTDYKRSERHHGGNAPFCVRRDFLKAVLASRYTEKL